MEDESTIDPDAEREKLKKFQENEKKRYRAEQQRFELKHSRQLEEVRAQSDATIKELEQLQNEKRKMLMEYETLKLKELEEAYSKELREWKAQLKPRKQVKDIYSVLLIIYPVYVDSVITFSVLSSFLLLPKYLSVSKKELSGRSRNYTICKESVEDPAYFN